MGKKVFIDGLADAVAQELAAYSRLTAETVKGAVTRAGKTVREEIKSNAPVKTGKYAKSWRTGVTSETSTSMVVTVYSPSRYMLAHLLEHGHAKRGGGRTRAFPHIAPAEEAGAAQLEQEIVRALKNG